MRTSVIVYIQVKIKLIPSSWAVSVISVISYGPALPNPACNFGFKDANFGYGLYGDGAFKATAAAFGAFYATTSGASTSRGYRWNFDLHKVDSTFTYSPGSITSCVKPLSRGCVFYIKY